MSSGEIVEQGGRGTGVSSLRGLIQPASAAGVHVRREWLGGRRAGGCEIQGVRWLYLYELSIEEQINQAEQALRDWEICLRGPLGCCVVLPSMVCLPSRCACLILLPQPATKRPPTTAPRRWRLSRLAGHPASVR